MCYAMNDCNGNGECGSNGVCTCIDDYKFGDCSLETKRLNATFDETYTASGPVWYSFTSHEGKKMTELSITATDEVPAVVYVGFNSSSDPNQFSYDMMFKNVTSDGLKLSSSDIPMLAQKEGYSVSVYLNGVNEYENVFNLNSTLKVNYTGAVKLAATLVMTTISTILLF